MTQLGLVALALFGCSREPAPAHPTDRGAYAALEVRMPETLAKLGRLRESLRAAGNDCAQVARSLRTFASAHGTLLRELGDLMDRLSEQERERFQYEHHDEHERLDDLFAMTRTCPRDAEVAAAFALAGFRRRTVID